MKNAYIISTGTELLQGTTIDSNSVFLASQLIDLGINVVGKSTVGDNREHLAQAFKMGFEAADVIIGTGGLGPTFDDLTKIVASEVMGCELELRPEAEHHMREYFHRRQVPMPAINLRQAMFPQDAILLNNNMGTAPGMYLNKRGKILILLPGPPHEMINMYIREVQPQLQQDLADDMTALNRRTIKVFGLGESQTEEKLGELMNCPPGCSLALLANDGEISVRLTVEATANNRADQIMDDLTGKIVGKLGKNVFAYDEETLVGKVARLLTQRGSNLAVAESCTGGMLGKMITDLPGSSRYFWGGAISYSNAAKKICLGVQEKTLSTAGAVSPETAREMAEGIRNYAGTDYGLAITGIAGPDGGTQEKPVGLVYIALAFAGGYEVRELRYGLGRDLCRKLAAKSALDLLRRRLEYNQ